MRGNWQFAKCRVAGCGGWALLQMRSVLLAAGALPRTPEYLGQEQMQEYVNLTPDCAACAALCCVMLPFDKGDAFAFDKAGAEPCRHLARHECTIHACLALEGFSGCIRFDCLGAGQRVVGQVFGGRSWRDHPDLMTPMEAAFRAMRRLHEDYGLLIAAAGLGLTQAEQTARQGLLDLMAADRPQSEASLQAYETGPLPSAVQGFVATLRQRLMRHR